MPVEAPLWMIAVSTAFAVIIGKEIFGGTGMNIWNPALLARAFFFFSYPSKISGDAVWIADKPDTFSGATPLAEAALGMPVSHDLNTMFWGLIPGSIGETSTFCILLGAIVLLATGIASWRIMFSVFIGGFLMATLLQTFGRLYGHHYSLYQPRLSGRYDAGDPVEEYLRSSDRLVCRTGQYQTPFEES